MHEFQLGIIVPSYGSYEYVAMTVETAFQNTKATCHVLVVDDGHPDWGSGEREHLRKFLCDDDLKDRYHWAAYPKNGGYIRSLNHGLMFFRDMGAEFICCANSDLLFTPRWDEPLRLALDCGFSLVGPITNAPGTEEAQNVASYIPNYRLSDDPVTLGEQTGWLWVHGGPPVESTINGFCMMAKTSTWWNNAYDKDHVFCPRNEFDSKGRRNPTPLMTLNEYELQRRWHARNLKSGFCPESFVFHYRSVSRGDRYKKPGWYRHA